MKKIYPLLIIILGSCLVGFAISRKSIPKIAPVAKVEIPEISNPESSVPENDSRVVILREWLQKHTVLSAYALDFIEIADTYGIDWRLMPAISIIESSGGKHGCGFNMWGWGSCKGNFNKDYEIHSIPEAIDYISRRLSISPYYLGKTTYQKLRTYNSEIEDYPDQVINIMQQIQKDQ